MREASNDRRAQRAGTDLAPVVLNARRRRRTPGIINWTLPARPKSSEKTTYAHPEIGNARVRRWHKQDVRVCFYWSWTGHGRRIVDVMDRERIQFVDVRVPQARWRDGRLCVVRAEPTGANVRSGGGRERENRREDFRNLRCDWPVGDLEEFRIGCRRSVV